MYYPILRGKQNELFALREIKEVLSRSQKIIPVLEPVKTNTQQLLNCFSALHNANVSSILICNPSCGELASDRRQMDALVRLVKERYDSVAYGLWIDGRTSLNDIESFLLAIDGRRYYFLHSSEYPDLEELLPFITAQNFEGNLFLKDNVSLAYLGYFEETNRIIISDHFNKKANNSGYRSNPDEFFSDDHLHYTGNGYQGFGDYSIVGYGYSDTGGQALTVAIHFLYVKDPLQAIWIRHFTSETYSIDPNTSQMIQEALEDLVEFINLKGICDISQGCRELKMLSERSTSTNLGMLKRHSIKHHLELITLFLK